METLLNNKTNRLYAVYSEIFFQAKFYVLTKLSDNPQNQYIYTPETNCSIRFRVIKAANDEN